MDKRVCRYCPKKDNCTLTECDNKLVWKNHCNVVVTLKEYNAVLKRNMNITRNGEIPLNFTMNCFRAAGVCKR